MATSLPTPYRIDYKRPPPPFLTFRRFRGGDPPAASASSCSYRTQLGRGGGGGAAPRGRKGVREVILGDMWGGGDAQSFSRLLPSLTFPDPPMPSQGSSSPSITSSGHWCDLLAPLRVIAVNVQHPKRGVTTSVTHMPILLSNSHHSSGVSLSRSLPSSESLFSPCVVVGAPR